jgi:hypothetical protein
MSTTPANLNTVYGLNLTQTDINDLQTYLSGLGDLNPDGTINSIGPTDADPTLYINFGNTVQHYQTIGGSLNTAAIINANTYATTALEAFSQTLHVYNEGGQLIEDLNNTGNMTVFNDGGVFENYLATGNNIINNYGGTVDDRGRGTDTINEYNGTVYADGVNETVNQYGGTLFANGGGSIINVQNGPSDTINSQGGHNTINVAAFAGTETITGTSTDTLNLNDYAANASVTQLSSTETQIVFSDTGQVIDVSGITNINYLAPPPTFQDMSLTALQTLLAAQGVDAPDTAALVGWMTLHQHADGMNSEELVTGDTVSASPGLSPDGYNIQQIDIQGSTSAPIFKASVHLSQFPALHDITFLGAIPTGSYTGQAMELDISGTRSVSIYTGDLNSPAGLSTTNPYVVNLSNAVGDFNVHMGNDAGDTLNLGASLGSAPGTYVLGNGNGDQVLIGLTNTSDSHQHIVLGTGANDYVNYLAAVGVGDTILVNGAQATVLGGVANVSGGSGQGDNLQIGNTGLGSAGGGNTLIGSAGGGDTLTALGGSEHVIAENTGDTLISGTPNPTTPFPVSNNVLQSTFATTVFTDYANNTIMRSGGAANDIFNLDGVHNQPSLTTTLSTTGASNIFNINTVGTATVTGSGASDVFNVAGNGIATVKGTGANDQYNIGMGGGDTTVQANSTAHVAFADSWDNATVSQNTTTGGWDVTFADTGAYDHIVGVLQATFAGVVHTFG